MINAVVTCLDLENEHSKFNRLPMRLALAATQSSNDDTLGAIQPALDLPSAFLTVQTSNEVISSLVNAALRFATLAPGRARRGWKVCRQRKQAVEIVSPAVHCVRLRDG
jgi:hypothetical protein